MQTEISDLRARLIRVPVMQLKFQVPFSLTLSWCTYQVLRLPWMGFLKGRSPCVTVRIGPWRVDDGDWSSVLQKTAGRRKASVPEPDLGITPTTMFVQQHCINWGTAAAGEIFTALCISAHQAHFLHVIPTLKYTISLWASGINGNFFL